MSRAFDAVIVGGGSAGAVLASCLSADPRRKVPLLEAGGAFRPDVFPRDFKAIENTTDGDAIRRRDITTMTMAWHLSQHGFGAR